MPITVNLYTFAKKVNSTGRPTSSPLAVECVLKDSCSIIYPVIGIDKGLSWNPAAYNYAFIPAFNRYYYVNDWSFAEGLWWAAMGVDALATWRTNIYNATEYVLRSAASYDGNIIDTLFPAKTSYTYSRYGWNGAGLSGSPWVSALSSGVYIVGIINNDANAIGAVSYYAFTPDQFANFKDYLLGSVTWTGILATNPDIGENLFKALFNPFQYITSIKWFPFNVSNIITTTRNSIKIGWWEIQNISCYTFSVPFVDFSKTLLVYQHPLAPTRGSYLNTSPYNTYKLFAPPFGEFELDSALIAGAAFTAGSVSLSTNIRVDLISGKATLNIGVLPANAQTNVCVLLCETLLSIDIQLAQIYSEGGGETASNMINQLSNIITSAIAGTRDLRIANGVGVLDAASIGNVSLSQINNNGSLSQFYLGFYIDTISKAMTEDALTDKGRPLCKEVQLSTVAPGYIITAGSHIAIAGTETEIAAVNNTLDGGVFLE